MKAPETRSVCRTGTTTCDLSGITENSKSQVGRCAFAQDHSEPEGLIRRRVCFWDKRLEVVINLVVNPFKRAWPRL
jgi:hypothetical protein